MKKLTVALLFGGKSGEHEVSLRSAASILKALDREKYHVIPIGITKDGQWRSDPKFLEAAFPEILSHGRPVLLPPDPLGNSLMQLLSDSKAIGNQAKIDVVFPALHGTYGEDGTIQGLLDMANLPYVGAGVLGSSVGMDKDVMKRLLQHAGLPIVDFLMVLDHQWEGKKEAVRSAIGEKLGYPCFVKPANLGSSVGISKVKNAAALDSAMDLAAQYDRKIVIEKGLDVREIECSVLGNDDPIASLPGEIVPSNEFYDYESKYLDESSRLLIPAPLEESQTKAVQELATRTFLVTECSGLARVDFFLEKHTHQIYVNEINTLPGFTSISMYPKLWQATGLGYSELIDKLIQLAIERHQGRQSKKTTY
ncbi:MAG TPA: D-alanine--D-alanine ligase family protein [Terriglobia bacterium]|nr:D-alanine--D-alanine ligase family protein [Terriglobia bacterium]